MQTGIKTDTSTITGEQAELFPDARREPTRTRPTPSACPMQQMQGAPREIFIADCNQAFPAGFLGVDQRIDDDECLPTEGYTGSTRARDQGSEDTCPSHRLRPVPPDLAAVAGRDPANPPGAITAFLLPALRGLCRLHRRSGAANLLQLDASGGAQPPAEVGRLLALRRVLWTDFDLLEGGLEHPDLGGGRAVPRGRHRTLLALCLYARVPFSRSCASPGSPRC